VSHVTKKTPLVSVVMAVYNGEAFLRDSLASILGQSFTDFECIVVDDGSTDGSREIVKASGDDRVTLIEEDGHRGLIPSLNRGLNAARGEFIARMDCDDISHPDRFSAQIKVLRRNDDWGVVGTWIREFDGEGRDYVRVYPTDPEIVRCELLFNSPVAHPSVMFRRSLITEHGLTYRETRKDAEDYDLWARASKVAKLANIPRALLHYRLHHSQVSTLHSLGMQEARDLIRREQLEGLGIKPSEREFMVHSLLCAPHRNEMARELFREVTMWLKTIAEANRKRNVYESRALCAHLGQKWLDFCYFSPGKRVEKAVQFFRSPFSRYLFRDLKGSLRKILK